MSQFRRRHGATKEKPLCTIAVLALEKLELSLGLDAFTDIAHPHRAGQAAASYW